MVGSATNSPTLEPIKRGTLAGQNHDPKIKPPKKSTLEPINIDMLHGTSHAPEIKSPKKSTLEPINIDMLQGTSHAPESANKKRPVPITLSNAEHHLQKLGELPEPGNKNFWDGVGLELETTEQKRPAEPCPTAPPAAKKPKTETKETQATQDEFQKEFNSGYLEHSPNASMEEIKKAYQKYCESVAEKKPADKSI